MAAARFRFVLATPLRSGSWVLVALREIIGFEVGFGFMVKNDPGKTPRAFFLKRSNSSVSEAEAREDGVGCRL